MRKSCVSKLVSTFEQRPTLRTIFPLSLTELEAVVGDILPAKVRLLAPHRARSAKTANIHHRAQRERGADAILPRSRLHFLSTMHCSKPCKRAQRTQVSMKSASDKAEELTGEFTLQFNKRGKHQLPAK